MNFMTKRYLLAGFALCAAMLAPSTASAGYVVMTDINTADATINGGIFSVLSAGSGTGKFPSFVRLNPANPDPSISKTQEQAYNTTAANTLDNTNDATHNHEIKAGTIAVKNIGGTNYFVFSLDINESSGGNPDNGFISLDKFQIYTSSVANQSTTNVSSLGTLRYDMDAAPGGDSTILLDYANFSGSGQSDLVVYVPVWSGVDLNEYVYLYSAFGAAGELAANTYTGNLKGGGTYGNPKGNYGVSDGPEEWAESLGGTPLSPVPASASLLLAASGLVGLGLARFRRMVRRGPLAA